MRRIIIDAVKCKGCKSCSVACMQGQLEPGESLDLSSPVHESRNTILQDDAKHYKPLFCRHCAKPMCVRTCMSGALAKHPETGHVHYDKDHCGQCFMCVMSCPFGVLKPDRATGTYVVKCDFCSQKEGPNCVERCPSKAIRIEEVGGGKQ